MNRIALPRHTEIRALQVVGGFRWRKGFGLPMAFPVNVGTFRVGGLSVPGSPGGKRISSLLGFLGDLPAIVALVLPGSILFVALEGLEGEGMPYRFREEGVSR